MLLITCALQVACTSKKELQFPLEKSIKQELMPLQGLTTPMLVEVRYPYLIMQNIKQNDSLFHIYDLRTNELKCAFGQKGQGPDDFINPILVICQLNDFVIVDESTYQFFEINNDGCPILKAKIKPKFDGFISQLGLVNDSVIVGNPAYFNPNIYIYNIDQEAPVKTLKYRDENLMDPILDPNSGQIYANGERIIFSYDYKKEINFMDTEFNLLKKVSFDFAKSDDTLLGSGDENFAYTTGYLGKRYFYVPYLGQSWKAYQEKGKVGTILEVFDLNGNPIAKYTFEGKSPTFFAVDEETFTLYGTTDDGDPEDCLLVYKLDGLK